MKSGCEKTPAESKRKIELPVLPTKSAKKGIAESKKAKWRAGALITLNLLMIAHFIQWYVMGTTVSPIEPSEAMFTLRNGAVNAGMIFFVLAITATLIFGRFVCGWGCHIVALQDLCGWILKKLGLKPKPFRSRLLVWVPLIFAMYMFVWPTARRLIAAQPGVPVVPEFTNHLITTEFWATFPPLAVAIPFLFICGFMTVYFLGNKGFCTYGCPYGGFFGVADQLAPGKIRVTDACNECGHCTAVCTSNVTVHSEVKEFGMVVDPGCMKCLDCISVCPNDALYFGFGKPTIAVAKPAPKTPSLSWPEDILAAIVFTASLFAVWDVYHLIPMLMAIGMAGITAFLVGRLVKLVRSSDQSFYRWALRKSGKFTLAGLAFAAFSLAWTAFVIHSGFIRYHERLGERAYLEVNVPDELALSHSDPKQWLKANELQTLVYGKEHYATARRFGLFTNKLAISKFAWMEYLSGHADNAVALLSEAANEQTGQGRALAKYYRGAILNRQGKYQDAITDLKSALAEAPVLTKAKEELGESYWQLGRKQEAASVWGEAFEANNELVLAANFLSGASSSLGREEGATFFESQADSRTPNDARFHWMLAQRLQGIGMNSLAEKHFAKAVDLDPTFIERRKSEPRRQ